MYILPVLYSCRVVSVPLHSVYSACTFYPFLYSCRAYTIALSARVMYVLPVLYSCRAVAVPLHRVLYSRRATVSTGNVRFTRFVLVPCCGCTIAPRFVLAPCNSTGNVRFTCFVLVPCCGCTIAPCVGNVPFISCRACPLHSFVLVRCVYYCAVSPDKCTFYPLYSCRAMAVPLHRVLYSRRATVARVMYVLPVLYSCRAVAVQLHRVGNVLVEFVLVLWLYHCTVCTVLVL